ncbi:MAG: hydantoinase/oxoprolinase family protein, partial [Thermoplasmata archaeon]|nr:hydantoinase/oxoprolinase family protein [Thermoplasmata archaeon]
MRIGIDVGGTFTDFLLTKDDGSSEIYKVLSTPDDPSIGVMNGLREMASARGVPVTDFIRQVRTIVHGTTVTTNAVLTYRGAKTGLLTTMGMRDALEMRRGIREEQYNNRYTNVEPLVPRYLRLPVEERLDYGGGVVFPLNERDVWGNLELLKKENVQSIAICFMNSFANKAHEEKTAALVKRYLPGAYLTVSSRLLPSIRFYDRVSTTVLNSYVGPILSSYLSSLTVKLRKVGFAGVLLIMQSNGGVTTSEVAVARPINILLSGPAGGVAAAQYIGYLTGMKNLISFDMGGTSADISVVTNGQTRWTSEGGIAGVPVRVPMLDITTIGAGGGSIVWLDSGGALRVGPKSAGAQPGPVCYGMGGEDITV